MALHKRQQFVWANVGWMLVAVLALVLLDSLSYELYFVISLIGFLITVELTAPINVTPVWRARLKWIILLGMGLFGYIVIQRILAILPSGVL
jgi:hypothetical protein